MQKRRINMLLCLCAVLALSACSNTSESDLKASTEVSLKVPPKASPEVPPEVVPGLEVFNGLDEATARIARFKDKPYDKLIDADGYYQSETLIYTDPATGHEVWSLTHGAGIELANIERRNVFSADGTVFSHKSTRGYRLPDGTMKAKGRSNNYIMNADLTKRRRYYVSIDGKPTRVTNKFETWDPTRPRTIYQIHKSEKLYRVTIGDGPFDNVAELIYTFPNNNKKAIENISNDSILCVKDKNGKSMDDEPLFYIIDTKKKPTDEGFCRYRSWNYGGMEGIKGHDPNNEYRVHGIKIIRELGIVKWNYGPMHARGEPVKFSLPLDNIDAEPSIIYPKSGKWGQYRSHAGKGPDGRMAYLGGPSKKIKAEKKGWGVWVALRDEQPVFTGVRAVGGHGTWCGFDPDWYFIHISDKKKNKEWTDAICAGNADGSVLKIIARPFSHLRGSKRRFRGIPRPNQSPDATKCWFHSSMLMDTNLDVGSFIVVFRRPHAPTKLSMIKGGFAFEPHKVSREVKCYRLYRKSGKLGGWQFVKETPAGQTQFRLDESGKYMVTAQEWSGLESDISSPVITYSSKGGISEPVTGWDKTPPAAPKNFVATKESSGQYRLKWTSSPQEDVRYYNLYFSAEGKPDAVQARRFASPPRAATSHLDWSAPTTGNAFYAITAVDLQGNESSPVYADVNGE